MPLTKQELEQGSLFKQFKFQKSQFGGGQLGVALADLYVSTALGLSIGIQAPDGIAIELFRISGEKIWKEIPEQIRDEYTVIQFMFICDYIYGSGSAEDKTLLTELASSFNEQMQKAIASSGNTTAIIGGFEISYIEIKTET